MGMPSLGTTALDVFEKTNYTSKQGSILKSSFVKILFYNFL